METISQKAYRMLIGGEWHEASAGETLTSINPTTEDELGNFPHASAADVEQAVEAAADASEEWRGLGWQGRARILRELASRIREREEEFARLDTLDSGNPIKGMRGDARNASQHLEYFAGLASELKGTTIETSENALNYTLREPYGVVGRIIPFNHPFQFAAAKIAAPLAAGNSVVLKPAEQTSLSALELGELTLDLFPPGVINIVTGLGATTGAAIVRHPRVPRIAFTGSVPTGSAILRDAAEHIKSVSLELGGKNPMIVFPDVDVEQAAQAAVDGMNFSRSQGQSCGSNSRVFVHGQIHDEFVDTLAGKVRELKVGDPMNEDTDMGPLAFEQHYDRVMSYIKLGAEEGAVLITGGEQSNGKRKGYFVEPTVFTQVNNDMRIAQEEIFGPVVSVLKWTDLDDAIGCANDVEYGLTANIWTNNLSLAHRTARMMQAGYVWINGNGKRPLGSPFGGYKLSGLGKENSLEELISYTQEKNVNTTLL